MFKLEEHEAPLAHVLGIELESDRLQMDAIFNELEKQGIEVERVINRSLSMPRLLKDDEIMIDGRYPSIQEFEEIFEVSLTNVEKIEKSALVEASESCRLGVCCGVGTDIYLDPNEDDE